MKRKLKIDKSVNRSVVLCETTNFHAGKLTSRKLTEDSISFRKAWKKIPFFKRGAYHGADKICVIYINRNEYSRARRSLDTLEFKIRERLLLNVI